jgi:hypothetical protein
LWKGSEANPRRYGRKKYQKDHPTADGRVSAAGYTDTSNVSNSSLAAVISIAVDGIANSVNSDFTNSGQVSGDDDVTNSGEVSCDDDVTNPGEFADDYDVTNSGKLSDDVTNRGQVTGYNDFTNSGQLSCDDDVTNPGKLADDYDVTNSGEFSFDDDVTSSTSSHVSGNFAGNDARNVYSDS